MSGPLPSPVARELPAWAARVIAADQERWLHDWQPGDPLPLVPLTDAQAAERRARISAEIEAAAHAAERARRAELAARLAADPALAAQAAELGISAGPDVIASQTRKAGPSGLRGDTVHPANRAPAAPNLDSEGFSQRRESSLSRFSQQAIPQLGRIAAPETAGTLALAPNREARRASSDPHSGHKCCRDETMPYGTMTLVGRRTVYDADEDALTFAKEREAITFANSCRRWRCPCCKWRLRRRNRARAIRGALRPSGRTWFVTITLDRRTELYRAFRAAELCGERVTIAPERKRRRRPVDLTSTRLVRKPRLIGAARAPAADLLGPHRGTIEPGGRLLREGDERAESLISIRYQAQAWNRLRLMLERHFGRRVEYFKALELHPGTGDNAGIAHLHLLIRTSSLAEWWMRFQGAGSWRAMLARAGFGVVTKVELVRDRETAARYVTKMTAAYTSKDMAELPRWTRRGAWSRDWSDWVKPTPIAGFHWQLARAPEDAIREALTATGFALLDPADFRVPAAPL